MFAPEINLDGGAEDLLFPVRVNEQQIPRPQRQTLGVIESVAAVDEMTVFGEVGFSPEMKFLSAESRPSATLMRMAHEQTEIMHVEQHFSSGDLVRDIVIGMADGLTVPFALAAGLTGAVSVTKLIVLAGLAEIAAGSIAMGLGGYLAAKGDAQHYHSEREREEREIVDRVRDEEQEIYDIFHTYGVSEEESTPVLHALKRNPEAWVDFMMRFELGLEKPEPQRARNSAATIAASYIFGGFIPLMPYIVLSNIYSALTWSVVITLIALAVFGYIKGRATGVSPLRSSIQTTLTGGIAAAAAFALARLFSNH